jgi:hypothetical protein
MYYYTAAETAVNRCEKTNSPVWWGGFFVGLPRNLQRNALCGGFLYIIVDYKPIKNYNVLVKFHIFLLWRVLWGKE